MDATSTPGGSTFVAERDGPRLKTLYTRVRQFMASGEWRTLAEIAAACGGSEASVSARLREMRDRGHTVDRVYVKRGLHRYRLSSLLP
jgi:DNA-binding CsgD family transcriptional regulator